MAKEVKVKEKWVIDKFEAFQEEQSGLELVLRVMGVHLEWLRKKEVKFWEEVEKIHGLDSEYVHNYNHKTKTIRQMYKKPGMR